MKKILLFIILFLCSLPAESIIETNKITIQQAVSIAAANNLDIQSSRLNIKIRENNIKSANRLQNPGINTFYNFGQSGKGNPQQIGVSQTIEIGKRGARKKLAQSEYELSNIDIAYLEADLRMDVREAYTNLLAKKSVLTTMKNQEDLLNRILIVAKDMNKKGTVSEIDVLQAKLLLNQIKTDVNFAEYDVKTALYDFNKVINSPGGFYDTVEDSFTENYMPLLIPKPYEKMPEFDSIADKAIKNRFDIKIAIQNIDIAEKSLVTVIRQKIPDFELQGGYGYQNPGQSGDGIFKHGAYVAVNLINIPIFYSFLPEINNAKINLEQANLNYASVENKALNDLRKAYEKFLTAKTNLNYYNNELLHDSEELITVSRKSYEEGKIDLTTLLSMEESYRMILIAYTYALADYYNAWNFFVREANNENFSIDNDDV
ncbi:MAG: TolC family protein [Candidatus Gastranaerophilales bacterium]|nr:TolC family protein [Candidatus Gastranaerophilales bacterium]